MKDDKIDMDVVCATLEDAVKESLERAALPVPPKVIGIFDKKEVNVDAPMSPEMQSVLDQINEIAQSSGLNKVVALGTFLLHEDGTMTRAYHVSTGYWCAALGALEHLKHSMHVKYDNN